MTDVDRFKFINDEYCLLRRQGVVSVIRYTEESVPGDAFLGRFGGDESYNRYINIKIKMPSINTSPE